MLLLVRNYHIVLMDFMLLSKMREVEGVERSPECSGVGMMLSGAGSSSILLTKNQALSVLQHLEQTGECSGHKKNELTKSRSVQVPDTNFHNSQLGFGFCSLYKDF